MNSKKTFLPVGTLITSILGELNSVDRGEIHTGPNAEGFIETVIPDQESCYSVVFPKSGAAIWLTEEEVRDATSYTIGRALVDGEIVGLELDDNGKPKNEIVQWDGSLHQTYVSGETLEAYGLHNLREHEAIRVGVTVDHLKDAKHHHSVSQYHAQIAAAAQQLEREDVATILAALRYYQQNGQGDPDNRDDLIHDIATVGGELISRDDEGIDDICERLQSVDVVIGLRKPAKPD